MNHVLRKKKKNVRKIEKSDLCDITSLLYEKYKKEKSFLVTTHK